MPIEPPEIPPATPGNPTEPPPESPPGSPNPDIPPPVREPGDFFIPPRCAYTAQVPRLFSNTLRNNILLAGDCKQRFIIDESSDAAASAWAAA